MDITKLPKWAQDHIKTLELERNEAIKTLNEMLNYQTASDVYYDDMVSTGEKTGPSSKRKYIQSDSIEFDHAGVKLRVSVYRKDKIELSWSSFGASRNIALVPSSFMQAYLISKEFMD